jgi:crotonobetainyl-CoA:carnitine CoA-transferase CaiB-like acyl-CoA transferase
VLSDPQVEANGYMPRLPGHPRGRLAASPVQFDEQPLVVRRRAPDRGQHTDESLEAVGIDAARRAHLRQAGAIG